MKQTKSRVHRMSCVVMEEREPMGELMKYARQIGAMTLGPKKKARRLQREFFCVRFPWTRGARMYDREKLRFVFETGRFEYLACFRRLW